jgi:hypothetical protein
MPSERPKPSPSATSCKSTYTCNDYREEMRLLGLKRRLSDKNLSETEKQTLRAEIAKLEKALQLN